MKRKDHLMMILEAQKDWITGKELATILNISDRTVRSDISSINEEMNTKLIESDTKRGYRLIRQDFQLPKKKSQPIPETPDERYSYIMQNLLFKNQKINMTDIVEEIYISEYSLENDLKKIKDILKGYDGLRLSRRGNDIYLVGDEATKRLLCKNMMLEETQRNFLNMDEIAGLYRQIDLIKTKQVLESLFVQYNYDIKGINFPMLMIHIGIAIQRMLDFNYIDSIVYHPNIQQTTEYEISTKFFQELSNLFDLKVVENEIVILARLLISKKDHHARELLFDKQFNLEQIVREMLEYINHQFSINLMDNPELIVGLSLHLQGLLERDRNQNQSRNFYLDEIKKKFPFVFELAVAASDFISKLLHIDISEDEIGFIALHLGMAYSQINQKKYRTLLIFPKTQAFSKILVQKIESTFSDSLEIVEHLNYFEEKQVQQLQVDLIICNCVLKHRLQIDTVQISFFMNHEDEANIRHAIFTLNQRRLKQEYIVFLDSIITENFFYADAKFNNHLDALKFMCKNLYQEDIVEKSFYNSVIKRESFSPTSFAYGFAIPHALDSSLVSKPKISIMLLKKPIQWGDYQVRIIFLLAIDRFNNHILTLFFEWITNLYNNIHLLNQLIECKNFKEFIKMLKQEF